MYGVLNKDPSRSDAVLSFVKEHSATGELYRSLQVRVSEHDERRLSTEFQRDFLEITLSAGRHDGLADRRGAGEAELAYVRVLGYGLTDHCSGAGDYVYDTRWEASENSELTKLERCQRCDLGELRTIN